MSVFVCVHDIKSECQQNPCYLFQIYIKLDALLHKAHSKMLLVLRYQGSTKVRLSYHQVKYALDVPQSFTYSAKETRQQKQWGKMVERNLKRGGGGG